MVDRLTAFKVHISDLLTGDFVKESGEFGLGYVLINGEKVGRVNLIASVVGKDSVDGFGELSLDDGSGNIVTRSFDNNFSDVKIGDIVNVIGKVREFSDKKYVTCELFSVISDLAWIELRKLEMKKIKKLKPNFVSVKEKDLIEEVIDVDSDEVVEEEVVEDKTVELSPVEKILDIIRSNDKGDGVDIDDIVSESKVSGCESLINSLLSEGDIFEVKPGRVKVLE